MGETRDSPLTQLRDAITHWVGFDPHKAIRVLDLGGIGDRVIEDSYPCAGFLQRKVWDVSLREPVKSSGVERRHGS